VGVERPLHIVGFGVGIGLSVIVALPLFGNSCVQIPLKPLEPWFTEVTSCQTHDRIIILILAGSRLWLKLDAWSMYKCLNTIKRIGVVGNALHA